MEMFLYGGMFIGCVGAAIFIVSEFNAEIEARDRKWREEWERQNKRGIF